MSTAAVSETTEERRVKKRSVGKDFNNNAAKNEICKYYEQPTKFDLVKNSQVGCDVGSFGQSSASGASRSSVAGMGLGMAAVSARPFKSLSKFR